MSSLSSLVSTVPPCSIVTGQHTSHRDSSATDSRLGQRPGPIEVTLRTRDPNQRETDQDIWLPRVNFVRRTKLTARSLDLVTDPVSSK
jgi:hypothetical protein